MDKVDIAKALTIGQDHYLRQMVHFLGDYYFLLEKTLDEKNKKFIRRIHRSLLTSETYNKPFFITIRMFRYILSLYKQLNNKLEQFVSI